MTAVPGSIPAIVSAAAQIRVIASSSRLGLPLADGANHLLGQHQLGLLHSQFATAGVEGMGRFRTYAHPNSMGILATFLVEDATELGAGTEFTLKAGTGATVTAEIMYDGRGYALAYWGAGDTDEEVQYEVTDCKLRGISIFGVYRPSLDIVGGDLGVEAQDFTSIGAGLREGQYIIDGSTHSGIEGIARAIRSARQYTLRQAVSYSLLDVPVTCVPGVGSADPIGVNFHHQARRLYGTANETRTYIVYARTCFDGNPATDTYEWTVTAASGGSVVSGNLVRTVLDWDQSTDDLEIDATATDDLVIEFTSTDATATCSLCELSIYEKVV